MPYTNIKKEDLITILPEQFELFRDFKSEFIREIVNASSFTTFEGKETIMGVSREGSALGLLLDGEAEAVHYSDSGEQHRVGLFKKGDYFGEISLMTGGKTIVSVVGVTRCTVLMIPAPLFPRILSNSPRALMLLSRSLSERSRQWAFEPKSDPLSDHSTHAGIDKESLGKKPEIILIINCGSASVKYRIYNTADSAGNVTGRISNVGFGKMTLTQQSLKGTVTQILKEGSYADAIEAMAHALCSGNDAPLAGPSEITLIGHRVVHGGHIYTESAVITDEVIRNIESLSDFAPQHNPVNCTGIKTAMKLFPQSVQVAVFDTAFHHTLPTYAYLYGLPYEYYKTKHIRKYGFHGMSHLYVGLKAAEFTKKSFKELEIISCHLGNGASMCAIDHGRSVDSSMGMTPTEGLIMGTRSGSLDPAILIYLMKKENMSADALNNLINRESGFLGISGISHEMHVIEQAADEGNHRALLAFKTFCYQIRKNIGAFMAAMQGLDIIIFTGGIGVGSAGVRSLSCQGLSYMGVRINEEKNHAASQCTEVTEISEADSKVRVLVVPNHEELMIARETVRAVARAEASGIVRKKSAKPVPVEISAHHVHLSQKDADVLFGIGHVFTQDIPLSQPGQYACKETVNLIGPRGRVDRVRVLGPVRKESQVEISMTEQYKLGIHPPIRESGDLDNSPGITLEGPGGTVHIPKGVICAQRHIHMSTDEAAEFGLRDHYIVRVQIDGDRELVFGDVVVRVNSEYRLAMHIDTDEANAGHIGKGATGRIIAIQNRGNL